MKKCVILLIISISIFMTSFAFAELYKNRVERLVKDLYPQDNFSETYIIQIAEMSTK
ncbi:MAG: hypothetical protein AB1610_10540 [Nitrospirota bacterium]